MKTFLLTATAGCAAAAMIAVAAQDRGTDFRPPTSRLISALDADHDGTISPAEIRSSANALRSLDTNSDHRLTFDEIGPAFGNRGPRGRGDQPFEGRGERGGDEARSGGSGTSADDLTDTLMSFDRNEDGKLERGEVPERFQGLFDRADANEDGTLTRDELKQSANATFEEGAGRGRGEGDGRGFGRRGRGGAMRDPVMRALDRDRDGVLSEEEIAVAADALKALDVDGDGQLSGDEIRPMPGRGPDGPNGGRR